jgi:Fe-S-cluster containining protein
MTLTYESKPYVADLPNETIAAAPKPAEALAFMRRATPQLRAVVEHHQQTLAPADFAGLIATIRSVFGKYTAKLLEFQPGADRGRALQQMMDREMGTVAMLPLACSKGCSGCCHYEVEITSDDAAVLKLVIDEGHMIDRERLAVQAARERKSPEWRKFWSKENRCVFLGDDGACGIYEDRPSVCRKHVVTTPAAACTTDGAAVAPVQVLLAEILLSAALSLEFVEFGSLAKMLTRQLDGPGGPRAGVGPNGFRSPPGLSEGGPIRAARAA